MEVARDPLRVVYGLVELVAHVDDAAGAAKSQHDERERQREHHRVGSQGNALIQPNAPRPPRRRATISTDATTVNTVRSVGSVTMAGHRRMDELEPGADLRVGEQVVDADGHREDEEEGEGQARPIESLYSREPIARGAIV